MATKTVKYDPKEMTLLAHLEELRYRLLASFTAVLVGVVVGWFFSQAAIDLLIEPIQAAGLVTRASDAATLQFDIDEDGTLRLRGTTELLREIRADLEGEIPPSELAAPLSRMEFFVPGIEAPARTWQSVGRSGVIYLRPMDPFIIQLKTAIMLGIAFALPVILYHIYAFISPGLLPHERMWVGPCYLVAILLFPLGAAFAFYIMKYALIFFAQYVSPDAYVFNDVKAYLSFVLTTMLAFGIVFELPVVVLVATRIGLVKVETLAAKRKFVFVGLMIICAVVTPTVDPFTFMAMTIPLYALFEASLVVSRMADWAAAKRRAEEEAEDDGEGQASPS